MKKNTPVKIKAQIKDLLETIEALDTAYELGEDCLHPKTKKAVTDFDYDMMKKTLIELLNKYDPNNEFLTSPSMSKVVATNKFDHPIPLASIAKANADTLEEKTQILNDWFDKVKAKLHTENKKDALFSQSFKRDGVSIALYYENGILVRAGLRPRDGIHGAENVLENAKYVDGIKEKLTLPITCSIRGELECKISTFEALNAKLAANGEKLNSNPRNYTAGSIRQFKNPKETKERQLSFTGHSIVGFDESSKYWIFPLDSTRFAKSISSPHCKSRQPPTSITTFRGTM